MYTVWILSYDNFIDLHYIEGVYATRQLAIDAAIRCIIDDDPDAEPIVKNFDGSTKVFYNDVDENCYEIEMWLIHDKIC